LKKTPLHASRLPPHDGIKRSRFFETINSRGRDQLTHVLNALQAQATATIPAELAHLGNLAAIDGSWIATDRFDLTAEDIAVAFKLRWEIEKFFAGWKRHLKFYHLIARSEYGLMVQILVSLITYLLRAIDYQENYNAKVSISRVRELRIQMMNESRELKP
jgi:IS4 transposase